MMPPHSLPLTADGGGLDWNQRWIVCAAANQN
jgi:hypothetical protein